MVREVEAVEDGEEVGEEVVYFEVSCSEGREGGHIFGGGGRGRAERLCCWPMGSDADIAIVDKVNDAMTATQKKKEESG